MSIKSVLSDVIDSAEEAFDIDPLGQSNPENNNSFKSPYDSLAGGNGLPSTKNQYQYDGKINRNIISWLVPEFGIVKMYVNPQSMSIDYNKNISKKRTKGGFSLQYWGEELPTIGIEGNTGSSGIEGINLLHEIYRAEQYAFDGQALTLEASNNDLADYSNQLANQAIDGVFSLGDSLAGVFGANTNGFIEKIGGSIGKELLGTSPDAVIVNNTLAQLAFSVEMYYGGAVYRGYFDKFSIRETTEFVYSYNISFVVTQERGYRKNHLPFQKKPTASPSRYDTYDNEGNSFDYSFKRKVK